MMIGLTALVERYLTERRTLGFQLRSTAYSLRSLAEYVRRTRHRGPLTLEVMAEWARLDSHDSVDPRTWARRLKHLRSFARWMQQFEPATEVPDDTIFGRLPERQAPHIYSPEELRQLLAAARELGPSPGLRGLIYETLFGLIASCGLRLSEALSLSIGDVDLRRAVLTIRRTKFAKSRQVPLHPSTAKTLGQYRWTRDVAGASSDDDAPFFIGTRGAPVRQADQRAPGGARLRHTAKRPGLDQPRYAPCAAHPRPAAHLRGQAHPAVAAAGHRRG